MKSSSVLFVVWLNLAALLFLGGVSAGPRWHIAKISMNGLRATFKFFTAEDAVNITASLDCENCVNDTERFRWSITEYPMLYDRRNPCSPVNIGLTFTDGGGSLTDTHGFLTGADLKASPLNYTDEILSFYGKYSILGRSLLLEREHDSLLYCASILPEDVLTAVATLSYPVSGTVMIRQVVPSSDSEQISGGIHVDLDVTSSPQIEYSFSWEIRDNSGVSADMTLEKQCNATEDTPRYNLTEQYGPLVIGTVANHRTYYFTDPNLLLQGDDSVLGMSLVLIYANGTVAACPTLQQLHPRTLESPISSKNISGTITFNQRSPFDYTTINVSLSNLRSMIGGYHVHEYPIPPRYFEGDNLASVDSVAGHFNPYGITTWPAEAVGTEDQYEVGDISSKFGGLAGKDSVSEQYIDWNMPLFGTNSIAGRSIVLHLSEDASRYAYGQIGYPAPVKTVTVDFLAPITGSIIMKQNSEDPLSETTVFVDIANIDGTDTEGHNWHVHVYKNGKDAFLETGRCASNGGHYNPFYVDLENGYSDCSPSNPRRCEAGDFSGKHGTIRAAELLHTTEGKFFFSDVQLPLSGPYSIDGRSVVIHYPQEGEPRLACHDTFGVPVKTVSTLDWSDPVISGTVRFDQRLQESTNISVDLSGLSNNANGWHVHVLPVPSEEEENICSATLGHFNPFNIVGSPPDSTLDLYEVGDLSGKFDTLEDSTEFQAEFIDETLFLRGPRSIDGRSIVVHRDDEAGSRWSCATLQESPQPESFLVKSIAAFQTESFSGSFTFLQTRRGNGYVEDASIVIDSLSSEASSWSILDTTDVSECSSDSDIYDPFDIQDDSSTCSLARLGQCIMGNLVGKHGILPSGGAVFTDSNLPLFGEVPILGRILRVEAEGKTFCSQILPTEERGAPVSLSFPSSVEFDPYDLRSAITAGVDGVEVWQVVVSESVTSPHQTKDGCQTIAFWVIGSNPKELAEQIESASDLGEYTPAECAECDDTQSPCRGSTLPTSVNTYSLSFFIILLFYSFM